MYEELRTRAIISLERRKKKERAMQVVGVIFGSAALFLFCIRYLMHPMDRPYMFIPIGIIGLAYLIVHTIVLGFPFYKEPEITEDDIEYEMLRIFRKNRPEVLKRIKKEEELELRQVEYRLEGEEYV